MKRLKISQWILVILGLAVFVIFCPLVSFIMNLGSVAGMLAGILMILTGVSLNKIKEFSKKKGGKILINVICVILTAFLIYGGIITYKVLTFGSDKTAIPENTPAIVLGCKVNGNEPSLMLEKRCAAAYTYLTDYNPEAKCIVSGGRGDDEDISEAQAMYNYLTAKGIDKDRIIMEDKSTTTAENMEFSKRLMDENNLGDTAVIITTDFHQYRASILASRQGIQTYHYSSKTGESSLASNILREWFCMIVVLLSK